VTAAESLPERGDTGKTAQKSDEPTVARPKGLASRFFPRADDLAGFRRALLRWFAERRRDLPWRAVTSPWRTLVSEIMLQQTTVETVRARFEPFLALFPNPAALASAPENEVMRAWEGLGYYRRARYLQAAARAIVDRFGGELPADPDELRSLPGLGEYTARAVASIAFGRPVGVLEANTYRVWARLSAMQGDPRGTESSRQLHQLVDLAVDPADPASFNQATMELGALVCRPAAPDCPACPIRSWCHGYVTGEPDRFGAPPPRRASVEVEHVTVAVVQGDRLLLTRRPDDGVWAGLMEMPRVEREADESLAAAARRALAGWLEPSSVPRGGPSDAELEPGPVIRHGVMHFKIRLHSFRWAAPAAGRITDPERAAWVPRAELDRSPLSSPQRRLVRKLFEDLPLFEER
jgi:A/G-specific adenine glycosylase